MAKQMFTAAKARALSASMEKYFEPEMDGQLYGALVRISHYALRGETQVQLDLGLYRGPESDLVIPELRRAKYVVSNVSTERNALEFTVSWAATCLKKEGET